MGWPGEDPGLSLCSSLGALPFSVTWAFLQDRPPAHACSEPSPVVLGTWVSRGVHQGGVAGASGAVGDDYLEASAVAGSLGQWKGTSPERSAP